MDTLELKFMLKFASLGYLFELSLKRWQMLTLIDLSVNAGRS